MKAMREMGFRWMMLCLVVVLISADVDAGKKPVLFELKMVEGETYKLADDLGKHVIILDFWATWCKPCLRELPHVNTIYEKYKEQGLRAYAISVDDPASTSKVKPTIKRYKFTLPVLLDPDNEVIRNYSPSRNVPYLVVIGADGEIIREFSGYKPGDETLVEEIVVEELKKLKPPVEAVAQ
ncbi:TlpA family protein disulfide reductase [bacterium]|nr:TlpA family protein disulfide reductase [candidate division CSSED10-310 bacterium]